MQKSCRVVVGNSQTASYFRNSKELPAFKDSGSVARQYWDGTGYILLYKRLTEKRFQWPRNEKELKKLTQQEFRWLMEGLSITQTKAFVPGKPGTVC